MCFSVHQKAEGEVQSSWMKHQQKSIKKRFNITMAKLFWKGKDDVMESCEKKMKPII